MVDGLLASIGFYSDNGGVPAGQCVYISFDDLMFLDSAMGRECYIYSVALGTAEGGLMGNNYEVIYRVSVDYSGDKTASVYDDFTGDGEYYEPNDAGWNGEGRGDIIGSDPGDGGLIAWWGTYVSSGYSIDITEVTSNSFYFAFRMTTTTQNTVVAEGRAEIDQTGYFATSGDIGFSLYEGFGIIEVFVFSSENLEVDDLGGEYERQD